MPANILFIARLVRLADGIACHGYFRSEMAYDAAYQKACYMFGTDHKVLSVCPQGPERVAWVDIELEQRRKRAEERGEP